MNNPMSYTDPSGYVEIGHQDVVFYNEVMNQMIMQLAADDYNMRIWLSGESAPFDLLFAEAFGSQGHVEGGSTPDKTDQSSSESTQGDGGKKEGDKSDGPPEGYRYASHDEVHDIMGTTQIGKDFAHSVVFSTVGNFVKGAGNGSWGAGLFFGAAAFLKGKYYDNMYTHYSENGNMEGVYYRDRFEISGDYVSWYRDVIYVNGQGNWIIQP